jgi:hypothetical protein
LKYVRADSVVTCNGGHQIMKALALLALFIVALQAGFFYSITAPATAPSPAAAQVEVAHRTPPAQPARS